MSLAKIETRRIFDKTKIKKNDVVIVPISKQKGLFKYETVKVFAIVNEVQDTCINVRLSVVGLDTNYSNTFIGVEYADDISVIHSAIDLE